MSWTEEKVEKLKELWGKGSTASQIAEIIGGISRNAVIGKAHRLNLSAKFVKRSKINSSNNNRNNNNEPKYLEKRSRKIKFRSLLLDKNFEPAKNLSLEELNVMDNKKIFLQFFFHKMKMNSHLGDLPYIYMCFHLILLNLNFLLVQNFYLKVKK